MRAFQTISLLYCQLVIMIYDVRCTSYCDTNSFVRYTLVVISRKVKLRFSWNWAHVQNLSKTSSLLGLTFNRGGLATLRVLGFTLFTGPPVPSIAFSFSLLLPFLLVSLSYQPGQSRQKSGSTGIAFKEILIKLGLIFIAVDPQKVSITKFQVH